MAGRFHEEDVSMKYDAIIVGSGQAGNPLAFRLADLGWSVALVEEKNLGGTCINVGCTPTKTMVHRAQVAHYARNAARWGVDTTGVKVDLAKIVAQKDEVVLQRMKCTESLWCLGCGYRGREFRQMCRRDVTRGTIRHQGPQMVPGEEPGIAM